MVLAQFVLIPSFSIQTKACEWGEVTIILMDLPVNARHLRALASCSKGKRNKRDEAPKVTALDLEGTSVQPASHGMGELVGILSKDI